MQLKSVEQNNLRLTLLCYISRKGGCAGRCHRRHFVTLTQAQYCSRCQRRQPQLQLEPI